MGTSTTRIALICDYSLEYLGGAQSALLDEASVLRDAGRTVTLIAPTTARRSPATAAGAPDIAIPARWTLPGVDLPVVRNTAAVRDRLRTVFVERAIEVVHVHSEFGLTAAALDVAAELGLPVVHTVHTFFWQGPPLGLLDRPAAGAVRVFARWLRGEPVATARLAPARLDSALRGITLTAARRARTVVSPSAHQADRLRDTGLADVVVVPNTMPSAAEPAEPLTDAGHPLRIAWVGRLVPEKRILEFVDAVRRAEAALAPGALEVRIVGDGPLAERAAELATGSTAIRLLGRLDRDAVRREMRGAHLIALTSFGFDNQPVIVVEAFNEARSVLYVDPALQEGLAEAGILSPAPDASGIAATIIALAEEPARAVAASRRARDAAALFSPAAHLASLDRIYAADDRKDRA